MYYDNMTQELGTLYTSRSSNAMERSSLLYNNSMGFK